MFLASWTFPVLYKLLIRNDDTELMTSENAGEPRRLVLEKAEPPFIIFLPDCQSFLFAVLFVNMYI